MRFLRWEKFVVALVVLAGGALVFGFAWPSQGGRFQEIILTATITIVSAVVGHYFGSRGLENAQAEATESETEKRLAGAQLTAALEAAIREIEDLKPHAAAHARLLSVAEDDPVLKERIKSIPDEPEGR